MISGNNKISCFKYGSKQLAEVETRVQSVKLVQILQKLNTSNVCYKPDIKKKNRHKDL